MFSHIPCVVKVEIKTSWTNIYRLFFVNNDNNDMIIISSASKVEMNVHYVSNLYILLVVIRCQIMIIIVTLYP